MLTSLTELDLDAIYDRVGYYNRMRAPFALPPDATPFRPRLTGKHSAYQLDLYEVVRYFDPELRVAYRFGDETRPPARPCLVKARMIDDPTPTGVLFNLNKDRHLVFVRDPLPFEEKFDQVVWRGRACQPQRVAFLRQFHDHPDCNVGHYHKRHQDVPWTKPYLSIAEQLRYKFVCSIEGNDVATNLKWICSSQSLCFMPQPRRETWFMEGRLVPGRHYVQLREDCADLPEKVAYYSRHPDAAQSIIAAANQWVKQFLDPQTERAIALLVLIKYFHDSGQWPHPLPPGYPFT